MKISKNRGGRFFKGAGEGGLRHFEEAKLLPLSHLLKKKPSPWIFKKKFNV